ncbi:MAG TPA: SDR family oxidoreductase [Solirubrobacteraceae bacterium]
MSLPDPSADATVVVTGASSGIGGELARELSRRGHHVSLVARRRDRLEELQRDLGGDDAAEVVEADLGTDTARTELIARLEAGRRHVAGLCNNAGVGAFGRFDKLPLEQHTAMVELNVDALHHMTAALVPGMVRRGEGAVLNVASTAAFQPLVGLATYAATKAFVQTLSEAAHTELSGTGVSITALCPGPTESEWAEQAGMEGGWGSALSGALILSAEDVAQAGIEGMVKGKRTVVPGIQNKASTLGGRFVPRTLLLPVAKRVMEGRL